MSGRRSVLERAIAPAFACALAMLAGCGDAARESGGAPAAPAVQNGPLDGLVTPARLPAPSDPHLVQGGVIWGGTCQGCHGLGIAGSPKITDREAWAPRIAQGAETLYAHALNGHFGPEGTMMPPRGGNADLTDDEVKAAVDFMISNSQ